MVFQYLHAGKPRETCMYADDDMVQYNSAHTSVFPVRTLRGQNAQSSVRLHPIPPFPFLPSRLLLQRAEERLNTHPGLLRKTELAYEGAQETRPKCHVEITDSRTELGRRDDAFERLDTGRAG